MEKEKSILQKIESNYDQNCLEVFMGDEIVWHKEINSEGNAIENLLLQEVDGGMRGIDIFGNEHFDQFELDKNSLNLYQNGEIIKRYARDARGSFRKADENGNIIRPSHVENYQPVAQSLSGTKNNGAKKTPMILPVREK